MLNKIPAGPRPQRDRCRDISFDLESLSCTKLRGHRDTLYTLDLVHQLKVTVHSQLETSTTLRAN